MTRSILLSIIFHSAMIVITALSLPFMMRAPIDLPPILSVELIQITDKTSIPFAAKAAKTLEKIKKKEEEKRVVSEQAPPAEKKKEKHDRIPLPEDLNKEKKQIVKKKQNPEEVKEQSRQVSEFEKKELFDPNQIAALIDKSKEDTAETLKKNQKILFFLKNPSTKGIISSFASSTTKCPALQTSRTSALGKISRHLFKNLTLKQKSSLPHMIKIGYPSNCFRFLSMY